MEKIVHCFATPFDEQLQFQAGLLPETSQNENGDKEGILLIVKSNLAHFLIDWELQIPQFRVIEKLVTEPNAILKAIVFKISQFQAFEQYLNKPLLFVFGYDDGTCMLPFGFQGVLLAENQSSDEKEPLFMYKTRVQTQGVDIALSAVDASTSSPLNSEQFNNYEWFKPSDVGLKYPNGIALQSLVSLEIPV